MWQSKKKLIALAGAIVLTGSVLGGLLGHTWSSTPDWIAVKPNTYTEVKVGETKSFNVGGGGISGAIAGNSGTYVNVMASATTNQLTVIGKKAGATSVASSTGLEYINGLSIQVVDTSLMESYAYKFSNKLGVYMESKATSKVHTMKVANIVTTTPADALTQTASNTTWNSSNTDIVTVDASGNLTAVAKGAVIINANFTDKYGVRQCMHYIVAVDTNINGAIIGPDANGDYWRPLEPSGVYEHVNADGTHNSNEPQYVYTTDGNPTKDSTPVKKGDDGTFYKEITPGSNIWSPITDKGPDTSKLIWGGNDKTPGNSDDKDAFKGSDGNYYTQSPRNIWTPIKSDGTIDETKTFYGGADFLPTGTDNTSVYKESDTMYWVEDITLTDGHLTSNVWLPVINGVPDTAQAIWGGYDAEIKDSDDVAVELHGNYYWINRGENIFARVIPETGVLAANIYGGTDKIPDVPSTGVYQANVYDNTAIDGHYYLGPNDDVDTVGAPQSYIGDNYLGSTGDGFIDSNPSTSAIDDTDALYWHNADGTMTTTRKTKEIRVTSATVSPTTATIPVNGTQQLSITVQPTNTTEAPYWFVLDSDLPIVTVNAKGVVTGHRPGTVEVMCQYSNALNTVPTCVVTVTADVTFNSNGGSSVASQTISTVNGTATEPAAPTKSGYTFGGWYKDSSLTQAYDFSKPVYRNMTLYAKWTAQ